MNIINFKVGDYSGDGHSITEIFTIETLYTRLEIEELYKKGSLIFGTDIRKDWCDEYDDRLVFKEDLDKLFPGGNFEEDDEYYVLDAEDFVSCFLKICKLADPDFTYVFIDIPSINVGGYGLFVN